MFLHHMHLELCLWFVNVVNWWPMDSIESMMKSKHLIGIYFHVIYNEYYQLFSWWHRFQSSLNALAVLRLPEKMRKKWVSNCSTNFTYICECFLFLLGFIKDSEGCIFVFYDNAWIYKMKWALYVRNSNE